MKNFEKYETFEQAKKAYEKELEYLESEKQRAYNAYEAFRKTPIGKWLYEDDEVPCESVAEIPKVEDKQIAAKDNKFGVFFVDDSDGREYRLEDFPGYKEGMHDTAQHPCLVVHIATKNCVKNSADFYVRLADLMKGARLPNGVWHKDYKDIPEVSTSTNPNEKDAWQGLKNTQEMAKNGSEIAKLVISQNLDLKNKGRMIAFIGTVAQYCELWNNKELISTALEFFGYGAVEMDDLYWTSTQYAGFAYYAWYWVASSQAWNSYDGKYGAYQCVPFFAI